MPTFPSDAELHAQASAYARQHSVSYAEAIDNVAATAKRATQAPSSMPSMPAPLQQNAPMTDAQADEAAKRYAAEHGVDYLTALRQVFAQQASTGSAAPTALANGHASTLDQRLDAAASMYARANSVSYSEALACVAVSGTAHFSETAGGALVGPSGPVQALQSQPIEIFRAGTHVDTEGNTRVFSVQDLMAMAVAYDPTRHEAPLTIGHPESDRPAYGWVKSLQASADGRLLMYADRLDPEFASGVKAGQYRKRSASFYPPMDPSNPAPGNWYLRHVAWLGAQPPAVKGMADVQFGAQNAQAVSFMWN